jgi:peptidoglycan/LPS O-acetylase OafA/YrhL
MSTAATANTQPPVTLNYEGGLAPRETGYVPELDTFRALAILSVMCLHWLPENALFNRLQGQISNGVHLFFVLSGFLITRILMQCRANVESGSATRGHSLRQFYARRFLRIFPVYYFVLILGALLHFQGLREGFAWHATYLSNLYYFLKGRFDGPASLFWTLAVEEQFYLVWPLLILFLPKRVIFPFVLAVVILGTGLRIYAVMRGDMTNILTPACINFLATGSLLAVSESTTVGSPQLRARLLRTFSMLIVALACVSIAFAVRYGIHRWMTALAVHAIDQPMMSLVYACLFAWASARVAGPLGHVMRFRPLVYMGRISYGLYVYHLFVSFGMARMQHWLGMHIGIGRAARLVDNFGVRFLITVAIASASWFLFEKPLNDLKRFFPYRDRSLERRS